MRTKTEQRQSHFVSSVKTLRWLSAIPFAFTAIPEAPDAQTHERNTSCDNTSSWVRQSSNSVWHDRPHTGRSVFHTIFAICSDLSTFKLTLPKVALRADSSLHSARCVPRQPSLAPPVSIAKRFPSKLLPVQALTHRRYGYSTWFHYSSSTVNGCPKPSRGQWERRARGTTREHFRETQSI